MTQRFTDFIIGTCLGSVIAGSICYMCGIPIALLILSFIFTGALGFLVYKLRGE